MSSTNQKEEKDKKNKRLAAWLGIPLLLSIVIGCSTFAFGPTSSSSNSTSSSSTSSNSEVSSEEPSSSSVTSSSEAPSSSEIVSSVTSSQLTADFRLQLLEPSETPLILFATQVDGIDYFITDDDSGPLLISAFNGNSLLFKEFLDSSLSLHNPGGAVPVVNGFIFSTIAFVDGTFEYATHQVTTAGLGLTLDSIYLLENPTTNFPDIYAMEVFSERQELIFINPITLVTTTINTIDNLDPYMAILDDISTQIDTYASSSTSFYFLNRFKLDEQMMYLDVFNTSTDILLTSISFIQLAGGTLYVADQTLFYSEGPSVTQWTADGTETTYGPPAFLTILPSSKGVVIQTVPSTFKVFIGGVQVNEVTGTRLQILGESDTQSHFVITSDALVSVYTIDEEDLTLMDSFPLTLTHSFKEDWAFPTQMTYYDEVNSINQVYMVLDGILHNLSIPSGDNDVTFDAFTMVGNDASSINLDLDILTDTLTVEVFNADTGLYTISIDGVTITDVDMIGAQDEFLLLSVSQDEGATRTSLLVNLLTEAFYVMNTDLTSLVPGINQNQSLRIIVNRTVSTLYVFNELGYVMISFTGGVNFPGLSSDSNLYNYTLIDREGANDYVLQFYRSVTNLDLVTVYVIYGDLSQGLFGMTNKGGYTFDTNTYSFYNLSFTFDETVSSTAFLLYSTGASNTLISMDDTDNEQSVYYQDGALIGMNLESLEETSIGLSLDQFIPLS